MTKHRPHQGPSGLDLMQLADGELDEALRAEAEAAVAGDADARARLAAHAEVGDLVRTHLERVADAPGPDIERRLGAMWGEIDKQLDLQASPAPAPARPVVAPARPGAWGRFIRWLDAHRGHILTGTLSAGAVAAIMLVMRPAAPTSGGTAGGTQVASGGTVIKDGGAGPGEPGGGPQVVPVAEPIEPVEVESLDVEDGSGTVFTVEGEDGEETTVIWLTDDTVEGI